MSLYGRIIEEAKTAMMAKESVRLSVLKSIKAAFMNELLAKPKLTKELSDEEALGIIKRLAKQRRDSIDMFIKGKRDDLARSEEIELKILETYLPLMMSETEIKKVAEKKKAEMGVSDKAKSGMLMSAVMKELKGAADGATVKKVIDGLLA